MLDIEIKTDIQTGITQHSHEITKAFVVQMRYGDEWKSAGIESSAIDTGKHGLNSIKYLIEGLFHAHGLID